VKAVPAGNWAGNLQFGGARVHRPRTVDELRGVVARAGRIRALGSGHSFSPLVLPPPGGELVTLDALPPTVEIDPSGTAATVGAGVTFAQLSAVLHRAGLALANLAAVPHISTAGSVATGTHGSGDTLRSLAASVRALEMAGPDGELVRLGRDTDPEWFPGAVVALGALGVVTRLTFDTEPAYDVAQRVRLRVPLDEAAQRFDAVFGAAYSVSLFTDWHGGEASVWLKRRADRPDSGWTGGQAATEPLNMVPGAPARFCTDQSDVPGPWYERLPHFRPELTLGDAAELQSEYYLPRAAAPAAFAALRAVGHRLASVLQIGEVRTVRSDDLWLSPAYGRDSVTFHFTWIKDLPAVLPAIGLVEEQLAPLGARPHWGKLTALPPDAVLAAYPRAADFAELARKHDPDGKFGNDFLAGLLPRG